MPTDIDLHHIGEVVLAGLLRGITEQGKLGDVRCLRHEDCSLGRLLLASTVNPPVTFRPNVKLAAIHLGGREFLFDGAHGIDVLCQGSNVRGIAIEAKLGTDRLAAGEFKKRFLSTVQVTGHKPSRIKGSMVAILNHRQIEALGALPLRAESEVGAEIARDWLLTVRGRVWKAWQARSSPALDNACHVVVFEDLVSRFGSPSAFDALVQSLVGDGFFAEWGLENGSA